MSNTDTTEEERGIAALILSTDDVLNASLDCDSFGLHYRVSSSSNVFGKTEISTISRWNRDIQEHVPYAQWERSTFKTDRFRFLAENRRNRLGNKGFHRVQDGVEGDLESVSASGEWVCAKEFIPVKWITSWGNRSYFDRTFVDDDGKKCVWKSRKTTLSLYTEDPAGGKGIRMAKLHPARHLIKPKKAYIELFPGFERILDKLVVTYLYAEMKRQEGQVL